MRLGWFMLFQLEMLFIFTSVCVGLQLPIISILILLLPKIQKEMREYFEVEVGSVFRCSDDERKAVFCPSHPDL